MNRLILVLSVFLCLPTLAGKPSMTGKVVIIDPGHGGNDPGSSGMHNGKRVVEDEYVYDVALRLVRRIKASGGVAYLTIRKPNVRAPRDLKVQEVFPNERDEVFALDGTRVVAGSRGLAKRIAYGNTIWNKAKKRSRVAWISIHFDVVGKKSDIQGVRIIAADCEGSLAKALGSGFETAHRLRTEFPVVGSGDENHGIRNLFVLGLRNKVRDKVLVELGNFQNSTDLWRIRNPVVREAYAQSIVRGLADW